MSSALCLVGFLALSASLLVLLISRSPLREDL